MFEAFFGGLNGDGYEQDDGGYSSSVYEDRHGGKYGGGYGVMRESQKRLFVFDEKPTIVHQTEKAMLFQDSKGKFWVPKALLSGSRSPEDLVEILVYTHFEKKYLEEKK